MGSINANARFPTPGNGHNMFAMDPLRLAGLRGRDESLKPEKYVYP